MHESATSPPTGERLTVVNTRIECVGEHINSKVHAFRLPNDYSAALRAEAKKRGMSMNEMLAAMVMRRLDEIRDAE